MKPTKMLYKRVRFVTWSCPRCGRPFLTEIEMTIHYLSCGK